ncbi:MAG: hypothetical protein J6B81_04000 [Spirochaetaceae bacterium]|nr:hypothetical protein [Spirochaetaceae bacterium]
MNCSDVILSASLRRDDYDSLWGMCVLLGLSFAVQRSRKTMFTISSGIHYTMLFVDAGRVWRLLVTEGEGTRL